jgi:hypothetical protein
LAASSEKAFGAGRGVGTKQQVVFAASTEGTGFTMQFSAHRSDSAYLFMHTTSDEREKLVTAVFHGCDLKVGSAGMLNHTQAGG